MAKSNAVTIAEIQLTLKDMVEDIAEIKQCLKNEYQTKEGTTASINAILKLIENLDIRLKKIEDNQSKITWAIVMAVLGAVMSLVLKIT